MNIKLKITVMALTALMAATPSFGQNTKDDKKKDNNTSLRDKNNAEHNNNGKDKGKETPPPPPPKFSGLVKGDVARVRTRNGGHLPEMFTPADQNLIRLLEVAGPINSKDIEWMRKMGQRSRCEDQRGRMLDNYVDIDLSRAYIVGGLSNEHDCLPRYAFQRCYKLRSIVMPERLRAIDEYAFDNCDMLREAVMPMGVESIGEYAFRDCSQLKVIDLPPTISIIDNHAFYGSALHQVILPDNLTAIGDYAFANTPLQQVELPSTLTTLGMGAFGGTALRELFLPASTRIHNDILGEMTNLSDVWVDEGNKYYASVDGVLYSRSRSTLYHYPAARQSNPIILPGTQHLWHYLFENRNYSNIELPATIESIGQNCFSGCKNLIQITLPQQLTSLGERAFRDCESLRTIILPIGITTLNKETFLNCTAMRTIQLPGTLKSIGEKAFANSGLVGIELPNSLSTIDDEAFRSCKALTQLVIPAGVTSIGDKILHKCDAITLIRMKAPTPPKLGSVSNKKTPLYIPAGSKQLYKDAKHWKNFKTMIEE